MRKGKFSLKMKVTFKDEPVNRLKNIIKMLLKKLIEFLKKKLETMARAWLLQAIAILFVVFVAICLAIWLFVNR